LIERVLQALLFDLKGTAQRFALAAAGEKTAWKQYKLKARKTLVDRARRPQGRQSRLSVARDVSPFIYG
jgi:hypothetical protein